jgi:hypothetical protein
MALGNSNSAIYLSVSDGKIVRRFKEPTAQSKARTNKLGNTVHEESYDYVEGMITAIKVRDTDYGKYWSVNIQDGSDNYILQFQYSGGNANCFLKSIPNADLRKPIKIRPAVEIDGDKKRSKLFLVQDDKALRWFWTKDNPGEMPSLKKIKIKGVEQWDDSDMMEFLEAYVSEHITPKLGGGEVANAQEDEDVPF